MRNGLTMYKVFLPNGERRLVVAEDEADAAFKALDKWDQLPDAIEVSEYNMRENWDKDEDSPAAS